MSGRHNMVTSRTFDAPVEQVWKGWSEESLVRQWWGPTGFTAPVVKMDFRVGGTSLVCMRSPEGFDIYNTWTYTRIVPMERIEFINHFVDKDGNQLNPAAIGLPPEIPFEVPHVLTFEDAGGKTNFTVTEYGYGSAQIAEFSKAGMDQCLDKLAAALA